jgi:cytochrome c556
MYRILFELIIATLWQDSAAALQEILPEMPGLHNLMQLSDDIFSGSEPVGEAAFASLQTLGVQTIVSVDGATPDIDLAQKYGIRYVHIPFGYDTIPLTAQLSLTRAARQSKVPLYIHCHHGKHRGPAAAAIVCRARGLVDSAGALKIMENAGTSRDYKGLWRDVEFYTVPSDETELPQLEEVAKVESLPAAMARIDRNFDHLKLCAATDWQTPADHPDLSAIQEALQLKESLHEASRRLSEKPHAAEYDATFRTWLTESNNVAQALHESLQANDHKTATAAFMSLQKNCRQCHAAYRDHSAVFLYRCKSNGRTLDVSQPDS